MTPRLLSVCTGVVAPLFTRTNGESIRTVMSAIRKTPVSTVTSPEPVGVGLLHVDGDESAELSVHGGRDKAVYCMPVEHYPFWEERRCAARISTDSLPHGFLGENFTLEGLLETDVFIGDTLQIGSVTLRVTAPREPCFKFNARIGYAHAAKHMVQQGNCGWYTQVMQAGDVRAGDTIALVPGPRRLSVAAQFAFLNRRHQASLF